MLKQSFASPVFGLGYINIWKINMDIFSIHWIALLVLSYVSVFLFYLSSFYLIFLIHMPIPWNVQTPPKLDPERCCPMCDCDRIPIRLFLTVEAQVQDP